ncbi:MAG: hypothetical protein KY475_06080 [Planctomycetes bacterium]|nr:hypothetical protein [Planctomycetota bacterium]
MRLGATNLAGVLLAASLCASAAVAQRSDVHYLQSADLPPGAVGSVQLLRGGPLPGYFQPVEIQAPPGVRVSLATPSGFTEPVEAPVVVGLLIGRVYRIKITDIPGEPNIGLEVFPTIELVNRLYPPPGYEARFPVPVQFAIDDLETAISGQLVTRVVYLEDPLNALPVAETPETQRYFEVHPQDDPLEAADRLGRPMAIARVGSRQPDADGPDAAFLYGAPPWLAIPRCYCTPVEQLNPIREGRDIPRTPITPAFPAGIDPQGR